MNRAQLYVSNLADKFLYKSGSQFNEFDILAFCKIESDFNPLAYRYEPTLNEVSYGLMQILLSSARDRGFADDPYQLFETSIGLEYGIKHLVWTENYLINTSKVPPTKENVVASFNQGVGNELRGRSDADYVTKWTEARARFI